MDFCINCLRPLKLTEEVTKRNPYLVDKRLLKSNNCTKKIL